MSQRNSTFNQMGHGDEVKSVPDVSMLDSESPPNYVTFRNTVGMDELRKDFKNSQDAILSAMEAMFNKQELKLNAMTKDLDDFKDTVKFLTSKYDDILKKSEETASRVIKLESVTNTCAKQEQRIAELEWKLDNMDQQSRLTNIEIANLPEKRDENLLEIVQQIGGIIKFSITKADILAVHCVPHGNAQDKRPKNIIVKLFSKITKDNILAASRRCKGITAGQLNLGGPGMKIYLNEHLTIKNKLLYRDARLAAKQYGYRFVWPKNGIIFVRAEEMAPVFAVRTREELQKIKPRLPVSS